MEILQRITLRYQTMANLNLPNRNQKEDKVERTELMMRRLHSINFKIFTKNKIYPLLFLLGFLGVPYVAYSADNPPARPATQASIVKEQGPEASSNRRRRLQSVVFMPDSTERDRLLQFRWSSAANSD